MLHDVILLALSPPGGPWPFLRTERQPEREGERERERAREIERDGHTRRPPGVSEVSGGRAHSRVQHSF